MKRVLSILILAALCVNLADAQDVRAMLREDPSRAGNPHHHYEQPEYQDTKAPRGYKPFYVSHYGRHGSRYATSERSYERHVPILDTLQMMGLLTEKGQAVAEDIRLIAAAHKDISGYLTDRGGAEHQAIAARLCRRAPGIFRNPARKEVFCASTPVQRCIQSMANFCVGLTRFQPDLEITMHSGERYKAYLCRSFPDRKSAEYRPEFSSGTTAIRNRQNLKLDDRAFMSSVFTDTTAAFEWLGNRRESLMYGIISAGDIANCLDGSMPDFFRHFSDEDIYNYWLLNNALTYASMADIVTADGVRARYIAEPILNDILEKADAALLPGSRRCADLRFGHDTGIAPLLSLLQVDGYNVTCSPMDIREEWIGFKMLCMASNIQFIFYRNKADDVLVKIIRNDAETTIPELTPYQGPYYRWEDLRAYFVKCLNK